MTKSDDDKKKVDDDKKSDDDKKGKGTEYSSEDIVKAIQILGGQLRALGTKVQGIQDGTLKIKGATVTPPDKKADDKDTKKDLEQLSREELVEHILKAVKTGAIDPVIEDVRKDRQDRDSAEVRGEIQKIAKEHPDFWEYEAEMRELAQTHPGLSVDDLYTLAQKKSPDKAAQIKEAADKKAAEAKEEEGKKEEPEFGGLLPTSGTAVESTKMDKKDAAEKAWNKVGADSALAAANPDQ